MIVSFTSSATAHAAECGVTLDLSRIDNKYGSGITQYWCCPKCYEILVFLNCKWVKSVVKEGRNHARKQPEINIKIAMGARLNGVKYKKMHGLLEGTFVIKMMTRQNTIHLERKF